MFSFQFNIISKNHAIGCINDIDVALYVRSKKITVDEFELITNKNFVNFCKDNKIFVGGALSPPFFEGEKI